MRTLLQMEWEKSKKTTIWLIILFMTGIPVVYGVVIYTKVMVGEYNSPFENQWLMAWMITSLFYASVFLPMLSAMIASSLCRYEERGNNWLKLFTYPVKHEAHFFSKTVWLFMLLALAQIMALALFILLGFILGIKGAVPWATLFKSSLFGWMGVCGLSVIQFLIAYYLKSYIKSMILNVFLCCIAFLTATSAVGQTFGMFYPWTMPYAGTVENSSGILPSLTQLFFLYTSGFLLVAMTAGQKIFIRRLH